MKKDSKNAPETAPEPCRFCIDLKLQEDELGRLRNNNQKAIECYRRFYATLQAETFKVGEGKIEEYYHRGFELNYCPVCGKDLRV